VSKFYGYDDIIINYQYNYHPFIAGYDWLWFDHHDHNHYTNMITVTTRTGVESEPRNLTADFVSPNSLHQLVTITVRHVTYEMSRVLVVTTHTITTFYTPRIPIGNASCLPQFITHLKLSHGKNS